MPSKPSGPLRRAQLVAPFGTGAMVVVPGGTSLIVSGLDYWYRRPDGGHDGIEVAEYVLEEWRLQGMLNVGRFRLPPDYREPEWGGAEPPNLEITIPAFRFPAWHFCPDCKLLREWPAFMRGSAGRVRCPECTAKHKTRYMFQVPFVAMCENGHLQDFPWREWVHRAVRPTCQGTLRLESLGSATLAGQRVRCDECGVEPRSLDGITSASTDGTELSKTLAKGEVYLCQGHRPWLGPGAEEQCTAHLRGSLRSASNVYFAQVRSSIYLPRVEDPDLQELEELLLGPPLSTLASNLLDLGINDAAAMAKFMKNNQGLLLHKYKEEQIATAIKATVLPADGEAGADAGDGVAIDEDWQTAFRREEFAALRTVRDDQLLKVAQIPLTQYNVEASQNFARVMLVNKLRETRALTGFTRVFPETNRDTAQLQRMLWKTPPANANTAWLPCYIVFGEGILLELQEERLQVWENLAAVRHRCQPLIERYEAVQTNRKLRQRVLTPRFVLLHTLAHLLINRLTFECGYSSAALRERLYVSADQAAPMAGILIYTADGDSEGTMGGLVRMGKPGNIEPVIRRALEAALWCSADPVCMEMGRQKGQGPDSCNLAACHNCALVPETACEEFNRFLDRGLVIGEPGNRTLGYFA